MTKRGRVAIYVDGENLSAGMNSLFPYINGKIFCQADLFQYLAYGSNHIQTRYYSAIPDPMNDEEGFKKRRLFHQSLEQIPRTKVIELPKIKRNSNGPNGIEYTVKGDDVSIAVDMMIGAYENHFDKAVLVSGDRDFVPVIRAVINKGKRVEVASWQDVAALRKAADRIIPLTPRLLSKFWKTRAHDKN